MGRDVDGSGCGLCVDVPRQRRHGGKFGIISSRSDETDSETD